MEMAVEIWERREGERERMIWTAGTLTVLTVLAVGEATPLRRSTVGT